MPDRRHSAVLFRLAVNRDGNSGRNIVRETLESAAVAAAVELATDADRANVIEINEMLEQAVRQYDPQTYHRESRRFHIGLTQPVAHVATHAHARIRLEHHRTRSSHGSRRAGGPGPASSRSPRHARCVRRPRRRSIDRGGHRTPSTAQQGGRHASPWQRPRRG
jgi:DNA-binding GntR family transcriptional regulator